MLQALGSGSFLSAQRVRVYSALLLAAYVAAIVALLATKDGINDRFGRPLGTDFANVYAAGRMALEGRAASAYDWHAHHEVQKTVAGRPDTPYFGWHYPPAFLLIALALAPLSYLGALLVYQATTLAAYLAVVCRIAPRPGVWLPALAFPAVFVNLGHGHNGFLTAALIGGALLALDRRPLLAGALIGCLAYKPQFGVLIPLVLAATGRWRVFAAAAATVVALSLVTLLMFGGATWVAFWQSMTLTQRIVLEEGATGFHKMQSVFAGLRLIGIQAGVAYGAQALIALCLAAAIVALWRSTAAFELKAAGLILASLLATPYALDYDLVIVAPALAFLAVHGMREGFAPYEITLLVLVWALPLFARNFAALSLIAIGPLVLLGLLALVLWRAGVLASLGARTPSVSRPPGTAA